MTTPVGGTSSTPVGGVDPTLLVPTDTGTTTTTNVVPPLTPPDVTSTSDEAGKVARSELRKLSGGGKI